MSGSRIEASAGPRIFARVRVRPGATGSRIGRGHSHKEPKMAQPSLAFLEVDKIDIEEGFNVRTHMDEDALKDLEAQVSDAGVKQSVQVRPAEGDRYWLVAGHRRLIAARKGGVTTVPALISEMTRAEAILFQLTENIQREDLNDVDAARGIRLLVEECGLHTNQEIADKLRIGVDRVGLLRRVAKLPIGVQRYIATGSVPAKAERQLRGVAAVSPRIAECVCEFAERKKIEPTDFVRDFDQVLGATADARFTDAPTMIRTGRLEFKRLIADKDKRRELVDRFNAAVPWEGLATEDPVIGLTDAEIDAARAAGCLVEYVAEHRRFVKQVRLLTDVDLAVDLIERRVEAMEADAAERRKASADGDADPEQEKKASDQRKAEHKKRESEKAAAREFNQKLMESFLGRPAGSRKRHGLARMKAIATVLISNNPDLAAAGLRLVRPQLQDVETKKLKSGEPREKLTYATPEQATTWLLDRIDSARSDAEVAEVLGETIICALVADGRALARTNRVGWHCRVAEAVRELLAPEIEEVEPKPAASRRRSKRGKGKASK
jgi:ParB/RepB/Spo0J family partition protein